MKLLESAECRITSMGIISIWGPVLKKRPHQTWFVCKSSCLWSCWKLEETTTAARLYMWCRNWAGNWSTPRAPFASPTHYRRIEQPVQECLAPNPANSESFLASLFSLKFQEQAVSCQFVNELVAQNIPKVVKKLRFGLPAFALLELTGSSLTVEKYLVPFFFPNSRLKPKWDALEYALQSSLFAASFKIKFESFKTDRRDI